MPLYNFICDNCGFEKEWLMSMKERESLEQPCSCPEWEEETFRFILGRSNFQLKGEGWAHDNYTKTTDANMHTGRKV